jgi:hypothetical protein
MQLLLLDAYGDYRQLLNKTQYLIDDHDRKVIEDSIASLREMLNACERILDEEQR